MDLTFVTDSVSNVTWATDDSLWERRQLLNCHRTHDAGNDDRLKISVTIFEMDEEDQWLQRVTIQLNIIMQLFARWYIILTDKSTLPYDGSFQGPDTHDIERIDYEIWHSDRCRQTRSYLTRKSYCTRSQKNSEKKSLLFKRILSFTSNVDIKSESYSEERASDILFRFHRAQRNFST